MVNINLLKELYKINSHSYEEKPLVDFICKYAKESLPGVKVEIDQYNNIYMTKGNAKTYPCVVAHTDLV